MNLLFDRMHWSCVETRPTIAVRNRRTAPRSNQRP